MAKGAVVKLIILTNHAVRDAPALPSAFSTMPTPPLVCDRANGMRDTRCEIQIKSSCQEFTLERLYKIRRTRRSASLQKIIVCLSKKESDRSVASTRSAKRAVQSMRLSRMISPTMILPELIVGSGTDAADATERVPPGDHCYAIFLVSIRGPNNSSAGLVSVFVVGDTLKSVLDCITFHPRLSPLTMHTTLLLDNYHRCFGEDLIVRGADEAERLMVAPFVVLSHGVQEDPIFSYGNCCAQDLFEMDWSTLTKLPSRYSAEPLHRNERAALLEDVRRHGFSEKYHGIRVSASGKRFYIDSAKIWMLLDAEGEIVGQAATFSQWYML